MNSDKSNATTTANHSARVADPGILVGLHILYIFITEYSFYKEQWAWIFPLQPDPYPDPNFMERRIRIIKSVFFSRGTDPVNLNPDPQLWIMLK